MRALLLLLTAGTSLVAAFNVPRLLSPAHQKTQQKRLVNAVVTGLVCATLAAPPCFALNEWQLMNGDVRLQDTIQLETSKGSLKLSDPTLINAGSGGAVFAFRDSATLLKVSWKDSAKSVQRECRTLQLLEEKNVESAERCRGEFEYQEDGRVMIAVEPFVQDAVASISQVDKSKQPRVVEQVSRTLVQMLAANIITIDVQPLISKQSGDVVFIDMTEAQVLRPPFSFLDKTFMGSFTTEMLALIPDDLVPVASKAMTQEIKVLESRGITLSEEAKEVLYGQTLFFPDN